MIDLRSDTVTKPSSKMLEAMASAELGDDVFQEDPTVNLLEKSLANRFGMEAGLFCPSGTMTNQIAVMVHTNPGDEVICDVNCHVNYYEQGGMSRNAGVAVNAIDGNRGVFDAETVREKLRPIDVHFPSTKLVLAENTCNRGGGKVFPYKNLKEIRDLCSDHDLKFHLDGARLYNAIVASGISEAQYGRLFDSISICLSKGLGCPAGSVLLGNEQFIYQARRVRKVLGGGMRQAGILAAAGLYAIENNVERLEKDHVRAKSVAETLKSCRFVDSVLEPETNILVFKVNNELDANQVVVTLKENEIGCFMVGNNSIRFVFHLDISETDMKRINQSLLKVDSVFKKG
ncbi:MAG: threonine aldolase [Bacteroidia bacterium]|jgi:threonine aldolase